jgi:Tol biopolymer transport system component
MTKPIIKLLSLACLLLAAANSPAQTASLGLFTDHADVGTVLHLGTAVYDAAKRTYTITGSGENVWATADAFQFVWKKMDGDFTLSADISILGQAGDPHKKAMLMARQSLGADSPYADVALHASGLASLQSRDAKGADTHEIQSNISAPKHLRLQKYGDEFTIWLAGEDGKFQFAGGSMRVPMNGPFYVGLGVCAHNKDAVDTAEFRNVALEATSAEVSEHWYETLETIDVASTDRRVTYVNRNRDASSIGAPTWTPDGVSLLVSHGDRIESVPVSGGKPKIIDTGGFRVNLSLSVSPDGTMVGSSGSCCDGSAIFVVPVRGGVLRRVTAKSPAFWQGWSPDGKTILFLLTDDKYHVGIYTMPVAGGTETHLIGGPGASVRGSAGYSPDGNYIYFHSNHSGAGEVWRMRSDGSNPEQVTKDGVGDWYPHVSPDGRLLAFLTPERSAPSEMDIGLEPVTLRVMTLADRHVRVLAKFTGANNSMPSPSWSPDSRRLAFVSYQGVRTDTERPRMFVPKKVK